LVTGNVKLGGAMQLTFPKQSYELDFSFMFRVLKAARGVMLTSRGLNMAFAAPHEAATLDAEVCQDGRVRFFYGRFAVV
jgi:hypothetical protein